MRAIIDFDTAAYAAASMAEGMDATQAYWNVINSLDILLARLNNPPYQLYLTGSNNFRYDVYPEYKANRPEQRPEHLLAVKEYLRDNYKAVISDGCEADDLCGIDQCESSKYGEETILVHIDKDLDMIPGLHFSPQITRLGNIVREERQYIISPNEALYNFYYQLLVGDPGDNVKGARGIGKVKAKAILQDCVTEMDYFKAVEPFFSCEEELLMNAQCLWIMREPNKRWEIPTIDTTKLEG